MKPYKFFNSALAEGYPIPNTFSYTRRLVRRSGETTKKKKPLMPAFAGGLFRNRPLARKPATTAERRRSAGYERGSKMDAAAAIAERRPPPRRKPNVTPFLEKRAAPNMECGSGAKPVWRARGPSRTALCSPPSPFTRDSGDACALRAARTRFRELGRTALAFSEHPNPSVPLVCRINGLSGSSWFRSAFATRTWCTFPRPGKIWRPWARTLRQRKLFFLFSNETNHS